MDRMRWDENHPQFYEDAEEFFDADPSADLEYWSRTAYWTIEEGVALSFGCEPRVVNWEFLADSDHPFAKTYAYRRNLAIRALEMGQLQEKNEPVAFTKWARGLNLPFCSGLEQAIVAGGRAAKSAQTPGEELLRPKERLSLLKMVLGMAIGGYAYDPKQARSKVTQEIQSDLVLAGIPMDVDTVRKWLSAAAQEVGDHVQVGDKAP